MSRLAGERPEVGKGFPRRRRCSASRSARPGGSPPCGAPPPGRGPRDRHRPPLPLWRTTRRLTSKTPADPSCGCCCRRSALWQAARLGTWHPALWSQTQLATWRRSPARRRCRCSAPPAAPRAGRWSRRRRRRLPAASRTYVRRARPRRRRPRNRRGWSSTPATSGRRPGRRADRRRRSCYRGRRPACRRQKTRTASSSWYELLGGGFSVREDRT
mmetsp:Transcript_154333/g.474302  ORF Transcript_154333/g.474302 Transcript_154333/m.474302 type:complete len:215 (+) Transcript_154333:613-1257(+)